MQISPDLQKIITCPFIEGNNLTVIALTRPSIEGNKLTVIALTRPSVVGNNLTLIAFTEFLLNVIILP
jgi:hypothetical protein